MPATRPLAVFAAAAAVAAGLAGCVGSTERATDVDTGSAVLRGQGSANNGPAQTYFEYWPTAATGSRARTPVQDWPGGVSGPLSQRVTALQQGTRYTFRLCGNDRGRAPSCAQQRTFETQSPDLVSGTGARAAFSVRITASSGPSGEKPGGTVTMIGRVSGGQTAVFSGTMGCLAASGNTAVVGFTGKTSINGAPGPSITGYAKIVDAATPGQGTFDHRFEGLTNSPDCGSYDGGGEVVTGDFTVTDAPPPAPPT